MDNGHILNIFLRMDDTHFNIKQKFLPRRWEKQKKTQ